MKRRPKSLAGNLVAVHNLLLGALWTWGTYSDLQGLLKGQAHQEHNNGFLVYQWSMIFLGTISALAFFGALIAPRLPLRKRGALTCVFQTIAAVVAFIEALWGLCYFGKDTSESLIIFVVICTMLPIACAASVWYRYYRGDLA